MKLSRPERELLEQIDLAASGLTPHKELSTLIKFGYAEAELKPWGPCFFAEVCITRQGRAIVNGLH